MSGAYPDDSKYPTALDATTDVSVAARCATDIAKRCNASVTLRAVTDPAKQNRLSLRTLPTATLPAQPLGHRFAPTALPGDWLAKE